jgi:hypothetical protein
MGRALTIGRLFAVPDASAGGADRFLLLVLGVSSLRSQVVVVEEVDPVAFWNPVAVFHPVMI